MEDTKRKTYNMQWKEAELLQTNNNLTIEGGALANEKLIKLAVLKERKKSSDNKKIKDFRNSLSSLPNPNSINSGITNHQRNKNYSLYPYESQQLASKSS